jgi:hypothetical protein
MFEIGDLVRFKASGIYRGRYNPSKKFGIVIDIHRNLVESLWGDKQDVLIVKWMPWDKEERVMNFYLEHLGEKCQK